MSFAGQIEYNSIIVNFVRQWNNFAVRKSQNKIINRAASGVKEELNFYNIDFIQAVKERLTAQELAELLQFYEFAKDGSSFIFLRDRDMGAYWGFEKTLNNNDENALTFTRTAGTAKNASYIDPSTGLLTFEDTVDTPRYDSGKYGHGLIIEGARTNLVQESEDFTVTWTTSNVTIADDTTEVTDPAGGNNAGKLTATAANGFLEYPTGVAIGTDDGAGSIYVRCPSGTVAGKIILINSNGVELTSVDFTATPEWQRVQVSYTNATPGFNWNLRVLIETNTEILYIYGGQVEVGADVLFASNYIQATDAATKTRNAERAKLAPTNIIGNLKGTVMFWFTPEVQAIANHAGLVLFEHGDSGGGDIHSKISIDTSGRLLVQTWDALGNSIDALESIGAAFTAGEPAHIAMTYDSTISNGVKGYYDGVLLKTSTNDAYVPIANQDFFNIGTSRVGGAPAFGIFDEILSRQDVLPGSSVAQIHAQGVGLGEIRNRWPAVALSDPDFLEEQLKGINRYNVVISMEEVLS